MSNNSGVSNSTILHDNVTNPLVELAALHQQYVKGVDILSFQDPSENIITKRPWIDEPSGSDPFDKQDGVTLTNVPPAPAPIQVVLSLQVPKGYDGVIKFLSCNVNFGGFNQFSGDIIWRLVADNKPIRNFENIISEKGSIEFPRPVSPIRIYSGQLIQWLVIHNANPALAGQIICSLNGYFYPSKGVS